MGAVNFSTVAFGKNIGEAFRNASEDAARERANDYRMDNDGRDPDPEDIYSYSGDICSKSGHTAVPLPNAQLSVSKAIGYIASAADHLQDPNGKESRRRFIREVPKKYRPWALRHAPAYDDKWGPACAIEYGPSASARMKAQRGLKGRQGKFWAFFGMASY